MRIAFLPLDSRPANYQFPQRLADIAGVELVLPPREWLGTLHRGAERERLLEWLVATATECDAAVFALDALVYGGLIQSRMMDVGDGAPAVPRADVASAPTRVKDLRAALAAINWKRCAGYALATVPRLGMSVKDEAGLSLHVQVREYLVAHGATQADERHLAQVARLEAELGAETVAQVWQWRKRNAGICSELLTLSCELGLQQLHFAVEDNAPTGPHLAEVAELRRQSYALKRDYPAMRATFFDGTDEALCLLLARAVLDAQLAEPLPLQLLVHPGSPGPDKYTGLYESQTLDSGLRFLADQLRLDYRHRAPLRWLVCYGKQPQPDVFGDDPAEVFNNPYLLPDELPPGGPLLVSDLCACNGANPHLAERVAGLVGEGGMLGISGWNTNFNTLGLSAAWLRLVGCRLACTTSPQEVHASVHPTGDARFTLERLADDLVYQSIARPRVIAYLLEQGCNPLDFSGASEEVKQHCIAIAQETWAAWCAGPGTPVLAACGIGQDQAASVRFTFPWDRAFECETSAGAASSSQSAYESRR
jgi:hypothetical protein